MSICSIEVVDELENIACDEVNISRGDAVAVSQHHILVTEGTSQVVLG